MNWHFFIMGKSWSLCSFSLPLSPTRPSLVYLVYDKSFTNTTQPTCLPFDDSPHCSTKLNMKTRMGAVVTCVFVIQTSYQLLQKKKETKALLLMIFWVLSGYYFISTTVHPWYITNLLLLSIFTNYRFIILWSYTLIFSYFAYGEFNVKESSLWLSLEYIPVFVMLIWEIYSEKKLKHH